MKKQFLFSGLVIILCCSLISCANSKKHVLSTQESQVKLRAIQTRSFDTSEKEKMLRTVIATLQDLGFVVDKADNVLGSISGTKLDSYALRMTVVVRPHGDTQMHVRANAQYNLTAIEDPEPYQQFFDALSKAVFLSANTIE